MAATVVVIAFANIVIRACGLVENAGMPVTWRYRVLYMYLRNPKLQLMVRLYMIQNRETATNLETDMQMFLECKIPSKDSDITRKTVTT